MIRSGLIPGVVFGTQADGDGRSEPDVRRRWSTDLGISADWATVSQVHGGHVEVATGPGPLGNADGIVTEQIGLPLAIATADCVPIAIAGAGSIGVVHAGWRGLAAGVIGSARQAMRDLGDTPFAATIGPHIGVCCYEVGDEVIESLGGFAGSTTAETQAADLGAAASAQLDGLEVETIDMCTKDDLTFASHRRDGSPLRQVMVAWRT
ncbi:MAG: laccase domain-containing protein [Acidimicrobiia bacterium]